MENKTEFITRQDLRIELIAFRHEMVTTVRSLLETEFTKFAKGVAQHIDQKTTALDTKLESFRIELKTEINNLCKEVSELRGEVNELRSEVNGVKADIQIMKNDIQGIKAELQIMKTDIQEMKEEIQEMKLDIIILKRDVGQIKDEVVDLHSDISLLFRKTRNIEKQLN